MDNKTTTPKKLKKAVQDVQDLREFTEAEKLAEPPITSKELEVSLLILAELRAIHEQLKTEVVTRDKFR